MVLTTFNFNIVGVINMAESFAELFEKSMADVDIRPGTILKATVVNIDKDHVTVQAGLKSEGVISIQEFSDEQGNVEVNVGDEVDVALDVIEDGYGETILSRDKAKRHAVWEELAKAHMAGTTVKGMVVDRVKGGFTVELNRVKAFLPGSLVDVRPLRDTKHIEGKELDFKIIKMDSKRNNIVVSRRAVLQQENTAERQSFLEKLQEGQEVKGIVKNLTDYGAFIDLGGVDGLLHITDISWKRIKHPSELLNTGDEITVKVLKYDRDKNRVSLGMKQMGIDPWHDLAERFPVGYRLKGKVTNITDYGCFVEIENGVEGLVHMSEMDWTNKNVHPNKIVQLGDEINVMVLEIDPERRRISLGMKQCVDNPWKVFAEKYQKGQKITGTIKSITDFGIFIGLEGNIDGLIHLSDVSWEEGGEESVRSYKKGQEIEAVILSIDAERERISLGIKQLENDAFTNFTRKNNRNSVVSGKVTEVTPKYATVEIEDGVIGQIKVNEISLEPVEDARTALNVGDTVEAKIISVDKKARMLNLSVKAKDKADEAAAVKQYNKRSEQQEVKTTLGDILKESMEGNSDEDNN